LPYMPEVQKSQETKLSTFVSNLGPNFGTCVISPFWSPDVRGGFCIFDRFMRPCTCILWIREGTSKVPLTRRIHFCKCCSVNGLISAADSKSRQAYDITGLISCRWRETSMVVVTCSHQHFVNVNQHLTTVLSK
jgi:hypothetical protein